MKKFFCTLFAIIILSSAASADGMVWAEDCEETLSEIYADGYCLIDADTLEILDSSDADERLPMASTTKIMTAIVALESLAAGTEVVIPQEAVGVEGSSIYLSKGEVLSLNDLLYGLLLESANDAAVAIAIRVAGDIGHFADLMNEKAKKLGMQNTHFTNPHGLPDDSHYSSAYDMARLLAYCLKNKAFCEIIGTQKYRIPLKNSDGYRYLNNHNRLLSRYSYCIGGKTGYTKTAGRCLVNAAKKDNVTLVAVTLGAPDDWNAHEALFDYGFSQYETVTLCEDGDTEAEQTLVGGMRDNVKIKSIGSVSLSVRKGREIKKVLELPQFSYAPVYKDEKCGRVAYYSGGVLLASSDLVYLRSVQYKEPPTLWERIKSLF